MWVIACGKDSVLSRFMEGASPNRTIHTVKRLFLHLYHKKLMGMNLQAEKLDLIEQLVKVDDEELLLAIKNLLEFGLKRQGENQTDFWDELSAEQKAKVELSISQLEVGQGISHEEVMATLKKKYGA